MDRHIVTVLKTEQDTSMNTLTIAIFACLAAAAYSAPSVGVIVKGPSGIVTDGGAWGVGGHGGDWDDGRWDGGHGDWDDGRSDGGHGDWDDGRWDGGWDGGHSNVVHGNGATLIGPSAGHAVLAGPVIGHGGGWGGGWGGAHGGAWGGSLDGGWGGHGVVVKGPPTVPATIVGPAGKIHAEGLWGPTSHWKKW